MGDNVGSNGAESRSGARIGRVSKIERLFETESGKLQYSELILAIQSRASIVASAGMIGVNPNTLTRWIQRGKHEERGYYRTLYDDCFHAVAQACVECEIEINHQSPKFYLERGMGRLLLGDFYNIKTDVPAFNYNLDGTVTAHTDDITNVRTNENIITPTNTKTIEDDNNSLTLNALCIMRDNGIDINEHIDRLRNNMLNHDAGSTDANGGESGAEVDDVEL